MTELHSTMGKLSSNQKKIIDRLGRGEVLNFTPYKMGNPAHYYWGDWVPGAENPIRSVRVLIHKGLVEVVTTDRLINRTVQLTEKGRALQ